MNSIAKNSPAPVSGFVFGSAGHVLLVSVGRSLIPLPEGADISTMDGLRESMTLFTSVNRIAPLLGHALGFLAGSFLAAKGGEVK